MMKSTPEAFYFNTNPRKDALNIIFGIIDVKSTTESNQYELQSSNAETSTDPGTKYNNISAFE